MKKVAIVQPYFFPYIGYFQLINSVDTFVFYDDVNFIKKGWIHRNRILNDGSDLLFTIPLKKASQNKLINEIEINIDENWKSTFFNCIMHNYKRAPHFNEVNNILESVLSSNCESISELAINSVMQTCAYLEIDTELIISSEMFGDNKLMRRDDRLIDITKRLNGKAYLNPQNGKSLYSKPYFKENEIDLFFILPELKEYTQFKHPFVAGLSIIDLMMFNSKETIQYYLTNYHLE